MILATRCPHCQTTFRVTHDQLKLYDGAVRCGVCQQIFNGKDFLLAKTPQESPPPRQTPPPAGSAPSIPVNFKLKPIPQDKAAPPKTGLEFSLIDTGPDLTDAQSELLETLEEELSSISMELDFTKEIAARGDQENAGEPTEAEKSILIQEIIEKSFPSKSESTDDKAPPRRAASVPTFILEDPDEDNTEDEAVMPPDEGILTSAVLTPSETAVDLPDLLSPSSQTHEQPAIPAETATTAGESHHAAFFAIAEDDESDDFFAEQPAFVRQASQKKRRSFFSGAFLGLATLLMLGAFTVQCLYLFSDRIVAWWPPAEQAVSKACDLLSCPRKLESRISALTIESSDLELLPLQDNRYTLNMLIRNSSAAYQTWPFLELTLNDGEKKALVRKAFPPESYLGDANRIIKGIAPYSEQSVKLYLQMEVEVGNDYRIAVFYP